MCKCKKNLTLKSSSFGENYVCLYYYCNDCGASVHKLFDLVNSTYFKGDEVIREREGEKHNFKMEE